jgi:hypothetical protein
MKAAFSAGVSLLNPLVATSARSATSVRARVLNATPHDEPRPCGESTAIFRVLARGVLRFTRLLAVLTVAAFSHSLLAAAPPARSQQLTSPDQVPEGLAKSDWSSIRAAYEAGRHAFQPTPTGWQARNPSQQWTTLGDPLSGNLCRANRKCSR